jgi:hypothetical protein
MYHAIIMPFKFHAEIASGNLALFSQKEIYLTLLSVSRMITSATSFANTSVCPQTMKTGT